MPVVIKTWKEEQEKLVERLSDLEGGVVLSGDGRSDSPGHSAKYGAFTVIEQRINKVLDVQLVQELVKVDALAKQKDCKNAELGRKSIINHLYWIAETAPEGDGDMLEAMWKSVINHIQDIHDGHSEFYPKCAHGDLDDDDRDKEWLRPYNELIDCELDTDLHALHYVFVPIINRALKQFQGAYNNHSLRTEHNWTPLMIWTNGILSSEHASETGVQDFYDRANQDINTESYGIDPDGPESNEFDLSDVTVPPTELKKKIKLHDN
ncbi:hypothetical protein AWC38_SpisGene18627 [Stylophora pistillata]|uniref:Integrase core domain-containing protein n=1 Tax=Stylophora pistillata TaxID=50429 RepID=A0A2B4RJT5_STYPI|nr:hypothetical protein AWC38_SpisGene18627 [Stylophora pistillata]